MLNTNEVFIHPTAIVGSKVELGSGTKIGPYAIVEDGVVLGKNCDVKSHAILMGNTTLGDDCTVFPFAVIGAQPQHLGYKDEPTTVEVGNRVTLREGVTVHRGTSFARGKTTIGDDSFLMGGVHVAHDCEIGRHVIVVNGVGLAGHVVLEDFVTVGGMTGVGQNCRVGRYSYIGGESSIRKDLPPFLVGKGHDFQVQGINAIGLERRGFNAETISRLKKIYKIFYLQSLTVSQAVEKILAEVGQTDEAKVFIDFVTHSKMGCIR